MGEVAIGWSQMKVLKTSRGSDIYVDDDVFEWASKYHWIENKRRTVTYASTYLGGGRQNPTRGYLHRMVMGSPKGVQIDHEIGNGLDCQRSNLRPANTQQNRRNQAKTRSTSSKFKGVRSQRATVKHSNGRPYWEAYITVDRKFIHLGTFPSEESAAGAYNAAATLHFGEFARLNEISYDD